jgi:hypothetical protein
MGGLLFTKVDQQIDGAGAFELDDMLLAKRLDRIGPTPTAVRSVDDGNRIAATSVMTTSEFTDREKVDVHRSPP